MKNLSFLSVLIIVIFLLVGCGANSATIWVLNDTQEVISNVNIEWQNSAGTNKHTIAEVRPKKIVKVDIPTDSLEFMKDKNCWVIVNIDYTWQGDTYEYPNVVRKIGPGENSSRFFWVYGKTVKSNPAFPKTNQILFQTGIVRKSQEGKDTISQKSDKPGEQK